jgi:Caspase domain
MSTLKKALIVGINNYGSPGLNLNASVDDARAMFKLIKRNGNGDINFGDVVVKEDVSSKADLNGMIIELFRHESDVALFYFSGHGHNDSLGYHLATPDGRPNDIGVSMRQVMNLVSKSPAKNRIVILDCCHAAGITKADLADTGGIYLDEGVTILASTKCTDKAYQTNSHSVFTNLLIHALDGGAADVNGNITASGIYSYIDKAMGDEQQRPVFKTNISTFVPIRTVEAKVPPETMRQLTSLFAESTILLPLNPSFEDTNDPKKEHKYFWPHADAENVRKFKQLQKLQSVGLVEPVGAPFMYFAAIESKACRLTPLGQHYWRLAKNGKI